MKRIIALRVNGDLHEVGVPAHWTLLEALRYGIGLTGSDGEAVLSCLLPVPEAEGRDVRTVEGLAGPDGLHPLQEAFDICGAAQCGFCTPGMLCSGVGLLDAVGPEGEVPSRGEIEEALSGNLCRCTGYTKIFEAVELAARAIRDATGPAAVLAADRDPGKDPAP